MSCTARLEFDCIKANSAIRRKAIIVLEEDMEVDLAVKAIQFVDRCPVIGLRRSVSWHDVFLFFVIFSPTFWILGTGRWQAGETEQKGFPFSRAGELKIIKIIWRRYVHFMC